MTDRAIIADATRVTSRQFLDAARPMFAPAVTQASENAAAAEAFIEQAWGKSRAERDRQFAEYQAKLAEIAARYAEPIVEVEHGRCPKTNRRRIAA